MFTKYWRSYPWFLQLFLFVMLMMIITSLGGLIIQKVLPAATGVSLNDIKTLNAKSSERVIYAAHYSQIIGNLSLFTLPCLLFAYLTHPRPVQYLGLRKPGKPVQWLLVAGIMTGFLFVSLFLEAGITKYITLPRSIQQMQEQNNNQTQGMLSLKTMGGLILTFFSMAILPPVGEELMFRGILLRFAHKPIRRMLSPMLITAFFFMLMHNNPYGMPFIFAAGLLLAAIYYFTGSLWCSIFAHLAYNGIQVVGSYYSGEQSFPSYIPLIGAVLLGGCLYGLIKNKTPLPANWSDDYLGEKRPEAVKP